MSGLFHALTLRCPFSFCGLKVEVGCPLSEVSRSGRLQQVETHPPLGGMSKSLRLRKYQLAGATFSALKYLLNSPRGQLLVGMPHPQPQGF